jgi:hypothetical protein
LSKLTQLKKLFVFQTDLEADANLSRLRLALPDCEVFASGAE